MFFLPRGRVAGFIDSDGVAGVFWMGVVGEDDVYVHYIQIETTSMKVGKLRTFEI